MVEIEDGEDVRAIVTPDLRLVFRWTGDRWTHALEVRDESGWTTFAEAVEAAPEQDDPARVVSPTYQDLQFHQGDRETQALLVGSFGPHHFSAVFGLRSPAFGRGRVRLTMLSVEVADRCRSEIRSLACTYRLRTPPSTTFELPVPPEFRDAISPHVGWTLPRSFGTITVGLALAGGKKPHDRLVISEAGRDGLMAQVDARLIPGHSTQRCDYVWVFASPDDRAEGSR